MPKEKKKGAGANPLLRSNSLIKNPTGYHMLNRPFPSNNSS